MLLASEDIKQKQNERAAHLQSYLLRPTNYTCSVYSSGTTTGKSEWLDARRALPQL